MQAKSGWIFRVFCGLPMRGIKVSSAMAVGDGPHQLVGRDRLPRTEVWGQMPGCEHAATVLGPPRFTWRIRCTDGPAVRPTFNQLKDISDCFLTQREEERCLVFPIPAIRCRGGA